jgi:hypothetical protein
MKTHPLQTTSNALHYIADVLNTNNVAAVVEEMPFICTQKPTVLLLNLALIGCILSLGSLLALSINGAPALVPHVAFLLFLAIVLFFLINWYIPDLPHAPLFSVPGIICRNLRRYADRKSGLTLVSSRSHGCLTSGLLWHLCVSYSNQKRQLSPSAPLSIRHGRRISLLHRFLTQVGTVDSAQQRKELFDPDSKAEELSQPGEQPATSQEPAAAADSSAELKKQI